MKLLLSEGRKLPDLRRLLHVLDCLLEADKLFILSQPRPLLLMKLVVIRMMGVEVRSLYYLFEEMPCLGLRLLVGLVSFQSPQS